MGGDRSNRADVRNPILTLPSAQRLLTQETFTRAELAEILGELALDARGRGEKCWRTHKAPMAAYWKAASVYVGHFRRALRRPIAKLRVAA